MLGLNIHVQLTQSIIRHAIHMCRREKQLIRGYLTVYIQYGKFSFGRLGNKKHVFSTNLRPPVSQLTIKLDDPVWTTALTIRAHTDIPAVVGRLYHADGERVHGLTV
jgi:hypothetical protein